MTVRRLVPLLAGLCLLTSACPFLPFFGEHRIASGTSDPVPPTVLTDEGGVRCTVAISEAGGPFVPAGTATLHEVGDDGEVQAGDRAVVRFTLAGTAAHPLLESETEIRVNRGGDNSISESGGPSPSGEWRIGPRLVAIPDGVRLRYGCVPVSPVG